MAEKKYAKFNEDGKTLQVGLGTDADFYKSICNNEKMRATK